MCLVQGLIENPFVGFEADTKQTDLNKGRKKATSCLTILGIDTDQIVKHTSGTMICRFGNISYSEALKRYAKSHLKKEFGMSSNEINSVIEDMFKDYQVGERKWGVHYGEENNPLHNAVIEHKLNHYLIGMFYGQNISVKHTYNGKAIDLKDPKFDAYRKPIKEENARANRILGFNFNFAYRQYTFSSLKRLSINGNVFEVNIPSS